MRLTVALEPLEEGCRLTLAGVLDESITLSNWTGRAVAPVKIDLAEVRVVDSVGIREWVDFLRALPRPVVLERCSEAMVYQFGMIEETLQDARVVSFYAPYECERCGRETRIEIEVSPKVQRGDLPTSPCTACGAQMVPTVHPDRYLYFLRRD